MTVILNPGGVYLDDKNIRHPTIESRMAESPNLIGAKLRNPAHHSNSLKIVSELDLHGRIQVLHSSQEGGHKKHREYAFTRPQLKEFLRANPAVQILFDENRLSGGSSTYQALDNESGGGMSHLYRDSSFKHREYQGLDLPLPRSSFEASFQHKHDPNQFTAATPQAEQSLFEASNQYNAKNQYQSPIQFQEISPFDVAGQFDGVAGGLSQVENSRQFETPGRCQGQPTQFNQCPGMPGQSDYSDQYQQTPSQLSHILPNQPIPDQLMDGQVKSNYSTPGVASNQFQSNISGNEIDYEVRTQATMGQ